MLYQCAYKKAGEKKRSAAKRIGRLKGQALVQARQAVYDCLKTNGYDPKTLSSSRQTPYTLNEKSGVNLALLFQTLQPLSKPDRIANIAAGVRSLSNEESHYERLARKQYLVLTDDLKLANYLTSGGIDVLNFNNLRVYNIMFGRSLIIQTLTPPLPSRERGRKNSCSPLPRRERG